jgi:hypothetical protein
MSAAQSSQPQQQGPSPLLYGSVEGGVCSSPTRVRKREDKAGQLVLYRSATQDNMAHTGPDNLSEERGKMAFLQSTWTVTLHASTLPLSHSPNAVTALQGSCKPGASQKSRAAKGEAVLSWRAFRRQAFGLKQPP